MRVSDSMLYDQSTIDIDQAQTQVQTLTQESSTGVGVTHPWDNPAAASMAVTYNIAAARAGAITQATSSAASELSSADAALDSIGSSVQQAVTLATQMGSGVFTAAQQTSAVAQVSAIQNDLVSALNTQVGNRYIFGGTADSSPPFDSAGNYSGNAEVRQVEVAPGVYQDASVQADVAIKGAGGGVDVFAALSALSSALSSNDQTAIRATEADLNTSLQQVFTARTAEGANAAAFQTATAVSQTVQTNDSEASDNETNVDEVTVATQLSQAQTVLQAAIDASSQTFQVETQGLEKLSS